MDKQERHARRCIECGKPFVARRSTKRYCSNNCRNAWWNKKRPYAQEDMFVLVMRPDYAPVCSVVGCGRHLYAYELPWGKCLRHKHGGIIQHREQKIPLTDSKQRERVQRRYHAQVATGD